MRTIVFTLSAILMTAANAEAAPASVTVSIGPELQAKAEKTLGTRDIDGLADDLRKAVERQLARTGAHDGARIELRLVDAQPNRPTFKQMGDRPGLSYESYGIGGARIDGRIVAANGAISPIGYAYYETDIRYAGRGGTWADADWTIQRLAYSLGRGETPVRR